jgi:hypothetical protein
MLSSRHLDEITKIDRTTGDVIWRWGGKNNVFTFLGDTLQFSHQHAIRRIDDGNLTLYDNGNFHEPPFSRAVEYAVDETLHTCTPVWQYRRTPDEYGAAMGNVQRLPNGNTIIGWGTGKPDVSEVDSLGSELLTVTVPFPNFNYRAYRFPWTAGIPLAADRGPAPQRLLAAGGPNPFVRATDLRYTLPAAGVVSLRVYDVLGREVGSVLDHVATAAGTHRAHVDLAGRAPGVYYARLTVGRQTQVAPLVLLGR